MKELFFLLSLTMAAADVNYPDDVYTELWARINKAVEDDMPQTAVSCLGELEQLVESRHDTLEMYEVGKVTLEQLEKYDWKAAGRYRQKLNLLREMIMSDLDGMIERYACHPRVSNLIYEKVMLMLQDEDIKQQKSAEQYMKIRDICALSLEKFPESSSRSGFQAVIDRMDSMSLSFSTDRQVVYPGQTVWFKVVSRNVTSADFMIFSLSDRYSITGLAGIETDLGKEGVSRKVEDCTISDYAGLYNISEETGFSHKFDKPGIYMVMLRSKDEVCCQTLYVSSVAVAVREVQGRHQVYVADAMSGKPAGKATIYAYDSQADKQEQQDGQQVAQPQYISDKVYEIDGFTTLTQPLFRMHKSYTKLFAEVGSDKYCAPVPVWKEIRSLRPHQKSHTEHYIFTDRKLYRPDDTVWFKLIALSTTNDKGRVIAGKKVNVSLYAPGDSKAVASVELTTSQMGSASGSFYIPAGNRNGLYRIVSDFASVSVRVEEYKDPGFRIVMPEIEGALVLGSQVVQPGVAKGYAGNPVSDARVEYSVRKSAPWYIGEDNHENDVTEGVVYTDSSGYFEVPFVPQTPSDPDVMEVCYSITARVTAMSGETFASSRTVTVSRNPVRLNVEFDVCRNADDVMLVDKGRVKSFTVSVCNTEGRMLPCEGTFRLLKDGGIKEYGEFTSGKPVFLNFKRLSSGTYTLECTAGCGTAGDVVKKTEVALFMPDDRKPPVNRRLFFYPVNEKDAIDFMVGSAEELFLAVEVFDNGRVVFSRQLESNNSVERITLPYRKEYKDEVVVSVFGIKDMEEVSETHRFCRTVPSANFDLKIGSLRDHTTPNTVETFTLEAPSSEALVSIYDVTTDRYGSNGFWFHPLNEYYASMPAVRSNMEGRGRYYGMALSQGLTVDEEIVVGYGAPERKLMSARSANKEMSMDMMAAAEEPAGIEMPESEPEGEVDARCNFAQTLAFIPKLEIVGGKPAEVKFTTRDGLSTFKVLVLAHTKDLHSGTATGEFTVSKAVMVQPNIPLFAVAGDRIVLKAPVSNMTSEAVDGLASIIFTDEASGREYTLGCDDIDISIPANGQETVSWSIEIPDDIKSLGVTIVFKSKYGSDAEKHLVEIYPDSRYVTEAESFIIGSGVTKESVIREMKKRYGRSDAQIRYEEYSTLDALKDVLEKPAMPESNNMIEWLDCLYVNQMRGCVLGLDSIDENLSLKAAKRLESLQKSDGGWGWFPCCNSSDELTMLFLDRMYYLRELGKLPRNTSLNKQIEKALGYIDKRIFEISGEEGYDWRKLIYFYAARMEHPNFAMSKDIQAILLDFLKKSKQKGWNDISIMEKAKLCTIYWATGEAGPQLRLMASLRNYSVRNKTVGCYFPNAVMPYRGLLHTEIYAHSVLAQMFAEMEQKDMAGGLFQWLLLQKHNQQWKSNMASADAIYALLKYKAGDLKFGVVYYTYYSPLLKLQPSANEISVKRAYFRDGKELKEGEMLYVGDRITAHYSIDNTENRSFVEMKAFRPACFYPADERSYGFWNLYCSKEAGATTYYFQVLPEEETWYSEEFFVTREGTFNSGLVEIESKYAPEYRGHTGAFKVTAEMN